MHRDGPLMVSYCVICSVWPAHGVCVDQTTMAWCRKSLTRGGALDDDRHPCTGPDVGAVRSPLAKLRRGWRVRRGIVWRATE